MKKIEKIEGASSVCGKVSAINSYRGAVKIVYVCGVPFEISGASRFLKRGKRAFVVYRQGVGPYPNKVVAVFVSPRRATWRTLQEAARLDELTPEMLLLRYPAYMR